jgi:Asp-tRNA(Asn)/Glu-tRNA(Gln) amidotransferase A subunit family amidase
MMRRLSRPAHANSAGGGGNRQLFLLALLLWLTVGCARPAPPETPAPTGLDVVELTIDAIQADYAAGRYSAVDLTRAFLARIRRFEDRYNAFISLNSGALATAAALDAEYASSGPRGPLHGIPLVLKDNIDQAGRVTTAGYAGFSSAAGGIDMIPGDDAAVVERLREAGAIILGKTNLPDFAGHGTRTRSSVAGVTLNPYNIRKAPGGSSGGTATAVNASFAVAGLGTETGGSIQNPASAQALVGVKPTFGLVPLEGVVPMSAAYVDVVGPIARSVKDAAYLLDVIAGTTEEDHRTQAASEHIPRGGYVSALSDSALAGRRFGLVGTGWRDSFLPLDPATERFYRQAIEVLRVQGAEVVEDPFRGSGFKERYGDQPRSRSEDRDEMAEYLRGLGPGAVFHSVEEWEALTGRPFRGRGQRRGGRDDTARSDTSWMDPARTARSDTSWTEPETFPRWRSEILEMFRQVLRENDLDGLFFPQASSPIPDLVEDPDRPDYNPNNHPELPSNIVNGLGIPVVTVPFAYYDDGTPFVLAFVGDTWSEAQLLAFAYDFEEATRGRVAPDLTELSGR